MLLPELSKGRDGSGTTLKNQMFFYKREKEKNTWHWCTGCSEYPEGTEAEKYYVDSYDERPVEGELCNECMAIEILTFS